MVTVHNVHERRLAAGTDPAAVRAALDRVIEPRGGVWPDDRWPALRLDHGLVPGSAGGHGSIRYTVDEVSPSGVTFRFDPTIGITGTHGFRVERTGSGVVIRHVLHGTVRGSMLLLWPLLIRPLHDALTEDALDGLEATLAGRTVERAELSRAIRWRRRLVVARQRRAGGTTFPSAERAPAPTTR